MMSALTRSIFGKPTLVLDLRGRDERIFEEDDEMTVTPEFRNAIEIGSGICWTLVYLLIIKHGFQDKTYGMPLWALAANISWEFIFAFMLLTHNNVQHVVDIVWCLF